MLTSKPRSADSPHSALPARPSAERPAAGPFSKGAERSSPGCQDRPCELYHGVVRSSNIQRGLQQLALRKLRLLPENVFVRDTSSTRLETRSASIPQHSNPDLPASAMPGAVSDPRSRPAPS